LKAGEIFHVDLDPTKGREQRGARPVLVVSSEAYNKITNMPVVAPITSGGDFARIAGFTVPLSSCGTSTNGVVRLDQLRVLDLKARDGTRIEAIPDAVLEDIINRIIAIFETP
jgi:mRNA-degrading endonuclease toxin of MazEF toxin-antitoxin module